MNYSPDPKEKKDQSASDDKERFSDKERSPIEKKTAAIRSKYYRVKRIR